MLALSYAYILELANAVWFPCAFEDSRVLAMSSPTDSPTRHIVLDDTDPSIEYIGSGWMVTTGYAEQDFGNFGPVYNNTLHRVSHTPGASFQFEFSGELYIVDASECC